MNPWTNEHYGRISSQATNMTATSSFTCRDVEQISENLNCQVDHKFISTRPGPGGSKLSYIEGWKIIELANQTFNFDGWSSQIIKMETDYTDNVDGKWNVGVSAIIRVTLASGTFHEDTGFGSATNERTRGAALEKAKKEASTDALKRALRLFGNGLGNCIYDKGFLQANRFSKKPMPTTSVPGPSNITPKPSYTGPVFSNNNNSNSASNVTSFNPATSSNFSTPTAFSNQLTNAAPAPSPSLSNPTSSVSNYVHNIHTNNVNNAQTPNTNIKVFSNTTNNSTVFTNQSNSTSSSTNTHSNASNTTNSVSVKTESHDDSNTSLNRPLDNSSVNLNSNSLTSSSSSNPVSVNDSSFQSTFSNESPEDLDLNQYEIPNNLNGSNSNSLPQPAGVITSLYQNVVKPNTDQIDIKPSNSQTKRFDVFSASKRYKNY